MRVYKLIKGLWRAVPGTPLWDKREYGTQYQERFKGFPFAIWNGMSVFRTYVPTRAPVIHILIVNKYRYIIIYLLVIFQKFMNFEHVFIWILFSTEVGQELSRHVYLSIWTHCKYWFVMFFHTVFFFSEIIFNILIDNIDIETLYISDKSKIYQYLIFWSVLK